MKILNFEEIQSKIGELKTPSCDITLLLDRPQSEMNIAHVFRLSDAARISKIYILQNKRMLNWDKIQKRSRRNTRIPHQFIESINEVDFPKEVWALEWTDKSEDVFSLTDIPQKLMLLIGNERFGLSKDLIQKCSKSIHIPMFGEHSSLNMAMATSIAVYQLLHKS